MGYETLKNMIDFNKEQVEIGKQEAMELTECPECAWPLNSNSMGNKACPVCSRIWR